MRFASWPFLAGAALVLAAASGAGAQNRPDVRVGDAVMDAAGQPVGTIRAVSRDTAVVWTGSTKVTLGLSSFRLVRGGLKIAMTRAQLEAAAARVQASGDEAIRSRLTPGTEIRGSDGVVLATVESVEGEMATLAAGKAKVRFPLSAFSQAGDGIRIGMTATQLQAAVAAQTPAAPAEAAPEPEESSGPADAE